MSTQIQIQGRQTDRQTDELWLFLAPQKSWSFTNKPVFIHAFLPQACKKGCDGLERSEEDIVNFGEFGRRAKTSFRREQASHCGRGVTVTAMFLRGEQSEDGYYASLQTPDRLTNHLYQL
ncbi:hypothetical protein HCBG_08654 [Histoplasma capsulatum G186AR]|uniref:Uncharacterized protein n=1 Tax=Ajellomyces capsulatus (strain G186AR / H82 / ATCC MYA-2454 / RMSCC 2432) TaxID=447093 RepID=C0NZS4_AJECG|nr:uncharacterized protein HCBG_08654 [Histoplasma capsulatum G186AR]EEH03014.1 hypothetical protein HCBG_08654 [Histoplasma capsulatum G186AR]